MPTRRRRGTVARRPTGFSDLNHVSSSGGHGKNGVKTHHVPRLNDIASEHQFCVLGGTNPLLQLQPDEHAAEQRCMTDTREMLAEHHMGAEHLTIARQADGLRRAGTACPTRRIQRGF